MCSKSSATKLGEFPPVFRMQASIELRKTFGCQPCSAAALKLDRITKAETYSVAGISAMQCCMPGHMKLIILFRGDTEKT